MVTGQAFQSMARAVVMTWLFLSTTRTSSPSAMSRSAEITWRPNTRPPLATKGTEASEITSLFLLGVTFSDKSYHLWRYWWS
jgi:hypothetical protein